MSVERLAGKRLGDLASPGRLRTLSVAVLVGRNRCAKRGDTASYLLTARAAELAVAAELLSLDPAGQNAYAAWLLEESAASLLDQCPGGRP